MWCQVETKELDFAEQFNAAFDMNDSIDKYARLTQLSEHFTACAKRTPLILLALALQVLEILDQFRGEV